MKKNPSPTRQAQPASKKPTAAQVPPLIAALARFTDPHDDGLTEQFVQAYAAAPQLVRDTIDGEEDSRYTIIHDISGLTKAREAIDTRGAETVLTSAVVHQDGLLRAVALLENDHADLLAEITTPLMDAGFNVGFAFAAYLLTERGRL